MHTLLQSKSSKRPSNDGELAGAKHELLCIQEMLEMAEKVAFYICG